MKVTVAVKKTGLKAYWVAIGKKDVELVNGQGSIELQAGPHIAVWYMDGNSGGSLSISGTLSDGTEVLNVKESKIPARRTRWADSQPFKI